jgi:putative flippase GtrA
MLFAQLPDRLVVRAAAFSLVGVANGVVGVAVIVVAGLVGIGPLLANALGYLVGLLVSFTLNSRFTFGTRDASQAAVVRFLLAFLVAFAVNLVVVKIATSLIEGHRLLTSLAGTPLYVAIFYMLCEYWVFRRPADTTAARSRDMRR